MPYASRDDVATQDIYSDHSDGECVDFSDEDEEIEYLKSSIREDYARLKALKEKRNKKPKIEKEKAPNLDELKKFMEMVQNLYKKKNDTIPSTEELKKSQE